MPIHDWTRLEPGDFHDFHQCWVVEIRNALNGGLLPPEYMAMAEQVTGRPIPDVVTLQLAHSEGRPRRDRRRHGSADRPGDRQVREDQLRQAGRPGRHSARPWDGRRHHRDHVTWEQGQSQRNPDVRREGGRHPQPRGESARRGPFPADPHDPQGIEM